MFLSEARCLIDRALNNRDSSRHEMTSRTSSTFALMMVLLVFLAGVPKLGHADEHEMARIDKVRDLADMSIGTALNELRAFGSELRPSSPYAAQRAYLRLRFELEMESGLMEDAAVTINALSKLSMANKDDIGTVLATTGEASLKTSAGASAAAIKKLLEISTVVGRTTDPESLSYYYRVLSNAQISVGDFEHALGSSLKALSHAEKLEKRGPLARVRAMNTISNVYSAMNNSPKALEILDEALVLAKRHGQKGMLATLYLNQGGEYSMLGRTDEYMASNELALKMSRESGQKLTEAVVLSNIGDGWLHARNYPKAESFSRMAITKYKEVGDQNGLTTAQANLGFALMGQGRVDEGASIVRQAIKIQFEADEIASVEALLMELGRMYEQSGRYKDAVATIREQQVLSQKLFKVERERAVATLQEQFEAAQRQRQLEYLQGENALKDADIRNKELQQIVAVLSTILTLTAGAFVLALYRRTRLANIKLSEANERLEFQSVRDVLTGLHNRRSFLELMQQRPVHSNGMRREEDNPDGLLLLDIDHFKSINDTLGHGAGDVVLIEVARRLRLAVRESDMTIRWGGEEFLVFSPKANTAQINSLAQRILNVIGETPIEAGGRAITVTASAGFVCLPFAGTLETECNWERAIQIADQALYYAKVQGRNRVCGVTNLLVPFAQASPLLESDLTGALAANVIEIVETTGPNVDSAVPRLIPAD
jgi:diguanylate cyclase (GGDEF)-like protein